MNTRVHRCRMAEYDGLLACLHHLLAWRTAVADLPRLAWEADANRPTIAIALPRFHKTD